MWTITRNLDDTTVVKTPKGETFEFNTFDEAMTMYLNIVLKTSLAN